MASLLSGLLFEGAEDSHGSHSSGYVGQHSGPHSGSGIDRSSGHGHHSGGGYSHSGGFSGHSGHSSHGKDQCCPLVIDSICLAAVLVSIAGATILLSRVIQLEITNVGRRMRSLPFWTWVLRGKLSIMITHFFTLNSKANI